LALLLSVLCEAVNPDGCIYRRQLVTYWWPGAKRWRGRDQHPRYPSDTHPKDVFHLTYKSFYYSLIALSAGDQDSNNELLMDI
jgi:hypothetical protein